MRSDAHSLRRFRVALVAVVAATWLLSTILLLLGWHARIHWGWLVVQLTVEVLLTAFAFRSPGGIATWWIVFTLVLGAVGCLLTPRSAFAVAFGIFDALAAVLLVILVIPAGRPARRARAERRRQRQRVAHGEAHTSYEVRTAAKRQARIQRKGYL